MSCFNIPINPESAALTSHQRHSRLVKLVRRDYQKNNHGSKLFNNKSGVAWQGTAVNGSGKVELFNPRPIYFGIPETNEGSGGADLLGITLLEDIPIFTAIECKTGKSRLKKNQKAFKKWILSVNGIHYTARECTCWNKWVPVRLKDKIFKWDIPECTICNNSGYLLEG